MTKTIKLAFFSAACFALSATTGFAQTSGRVQVKVPFEFTAGLSTLPAGEYSFQQESAGVVFISSLDSHKTVVVLTNPESTIVAGNQPIVKFDKVNGVYSLTEVDMLGEPGRRLIKVDAPADRAASLTARASVSNATVKSLKK